ncbi:MAG: hypothetical protein ACOX5G_09270 [Kiritimatiellia bacterium]|jgi:hypothetical protein
MKTLLRASLWAGLFLAFAPVYAGEWLDEAEFTLDPPGADGIQIVNARLAPSRTVGYDQLRFECVYHQEVPWKDSDGKQSVKIVEPVTFTYRRPDVRLVHELDFHCSFRVPIALEKLVETYGKGVFGPKEDVVIDRIRLSGVQGGKTLWTQEFKVPGLHEVVDAPPEKPEEKPPDNVAFGEIDLD